MGQEITLLATPKSLGRMLFCVWCLNARRYSQKILVGLGGRFPTLLSYLQPDPYIESLFQTYVIISSLIMCEGLFWKFFYDNDEKVASS